jgi:hypothetical protein
MQKQTGDSYCSKGNYFSVRGKGNPNEEGGAYQQADK